MRFGAPVLVPGPALQAAGGADLFMDQVHLLPEGHEVMARMLEPVVVERLAAGHGSAPLLFRDFPWRGSPSSMRLSLAGVSGRTPWAEVKNSWCFDT